MWVRQCDLDADADDAPPIAARIASNEEFVPPPQSDRQREYQSRLAELADRAARRQGRSRREFLRSGSGMAAALLALNATYGECYAVTADEVDDPLAFDESWPKEPFVFDVQTHHIDLDRKWYDDTPAGRRSTRFFEQLRPRRGSRDESLEALNRAHYVKEVFGDSDTVMAIISGVPTRTWGQNPLPPDLMVATRAFVNDLDGSRRVLSHGLLRPNLGAPELEELERQVKELKIDAWKMYTGAEIGEKAWYLDDPEVAYPFWERTKALGVKNLCVYKGLPLGAFNEKACTPFDVEKAAKDWPVLDFILYHSGFRGFGPIASGTGERVDVPASDDPREIPRISDVLRILKRNPELKNVYFELGSTCNMTSMYAPTTCLHMLGQMIQVAGADRVLWGTDSIWSGSPQGQIARIRRLKMPADMIDKLGYEDFTDAAKAQIFGLNAAKVFGVDPAAELKSIRVDKLAAIRAERRGDPGAPSNTQYGWVWVGDAQEPTTPVGAE